MKRILTLAGLVATLGAMAQNGNHTVLLARPGFANKPITPVAPSGSGEKDLTIVMNEDFANGLAGNTTFGAWTTAGADGAIWMFDTDGPNGDFSATTEKITSTTAANGFMIFDSNVSNDGCTSGGTCVDRVGYLVSPVMDLTATPDVQLSFEERFRWCCSGDAGHWVEVSTDGGLTWPTRIDVGNGALNSPMITNLDIGTHTKWIDISQTIAGNASAVAIRFSHEDLTTANITHYHWQVDDVQLVSTPNHDLQFTQNQYDDFIPSLFVLDGNTVNLEYTIYPYGQLHPLALKSKIRNGGLNTETNVTYAAEVVDPSSVTIFSPTSAIASMDRYAVDSLQFDAFTPPAVSGEYTVNFGLTADSVDDRTDDNTFTKNFSVDPYQYGYDDDAMTGRQSDGVDPFELANKFFIHNAATVYSVRVALATAPTGTPSPVGLIIKANVYDADLAWVAETEEHTIVAGDLNSAGGNDFVDLLFTDPLDLVVGEFLVAAQSYGGDAIYFATSGVSEVGSSLLIEPDAQDPDAQFFIQNNTPMIRLNFNENIGVEESDMVNGVGLGQNHPNPSNGSTIIPYSLTTGGAVLFEVHDLSGKLAMTVNAGTQGAGPHRVTLDTTTLPEGVYFYTLSTAGTQITKRMTVIR